MKVAYSFSVLRYVHDPVAQEFINIGVAVFSPEAKFLRAVCTTGYGRITNMFQKIDGPRFRQLSRYIQDQICAAGQEYESALPFESGATIEHLLARVLQCHPVLEGWCGPKLRSRPDAERTVSAARGAIRHCRRIAPPD